MIVYTLYHHYIIIIYIAFQKYHFAPSLVLSIILPIEKLLYGDSKTNSNTTNNNNSSSSSSSNNSSRTFDDESSNILMRVVYN